MTSCNLIIKDQEEEIFLYRHCDGYPEVTAKELCSFLNAGKNSELCAANMAEAIINIYDDTYSIEDCLCGCVDYLYRIEIDNDCTKFYCYDEVSTSKIVFLETYKHNSYIKNDTDEHCFLVSELNDMFVDVKSADSLCIGDLDVFKNISSNATICESVLIKKIIEKLKSKMELLTFNVYKK